MERVLLEGTHLLADALDAHLELEAVLATPAFLGSAAALPLLRRLPRPPLEIEAGLLDALADSDSPRGLLSIARIRRRGLEDLALPSSPRLTVVYADGLQDPGNAGALARVAEGAGVAALVTAPGTARLSHPRALRASAGSLLRLPVAEAVPWRSLDARLEPADTTWVCLGARRGQSLYGPLPRGPRVLVVGSESAGISPELLQRADLLTTIPMAGRLESLNATVAAAVVLFEWSRRDRRGVEG